jgi:hypothetical protein
MQAGRIIARAPVNPLTPGMSRATQAGLTLSVNPLRI